MQIKEFVLVLKILIFLLILKKKIFLIKKLILLKKFGKVFWLKLIKNKN